MFYLPTENKKKAFESLPETEKEKSGTILSIMDRFSIPQEACHELTQQESSLPKTYLVESCHKVIDDSWKPTRTL